MTLLGIKQPFFGRPLHELTAFQTELFLTDCKNKRKLRWIEVKITIKCKSQSEMDKNKARDCIEEEVWINKVRTQSDEGENRA